MIPSIAAKIPVPDYPVHPLLLKRWSARSFADKPIADRHIQSLFEAARWTASSNNEQPWMYLYASRRDQENFGKYIDCMMDGNKPWAVHADLVILSLARKKFRKYGTENRHAMHDVGAANTNLLLQAAEMDIYGHMIGGFHYEKTESLFNVPEEMEISCFIVLGYLDVPNKLEEPFLTRELTPRTRLQVNSFVSQGIRLPSPLA